MEAVPAGERSRRRSCTTSDGGVLENPESSPNQVAVFYGPLSGLTMLSDANAWMMPAVDDLVLGDPLLYVATWMGMRSLTL